MILIVGAGIAGVAAAKALELKGLQSEIAEKSLQAPIHGAAIFLLGNATRALGSLGILPEIEAHSYRILHQRIYDAGGSLLNEVSTSQAWDRCGPCLALPRRTLLEIMLSSLKNTKVNFGKFVVEIETQEKGTLVQFSDGTTGFYDAVIGADGIRSSLRNLVFETAPPKPLGITSWRFIVNNTIGVNGWQVMLGAKRSLLTIPLNNSKVYVYADCQSTIVPEPSIASLKEVFHLFREPLGSILSQVDDAENVYCAPLEEVTLRNWAKQNTVLIGDAAHASSPSMAQGAGMAIEDALVLADQLAIEGQNNAVAFERFVQRRSHRVKWVQSQCHARDTLRNSPRFLRDTILRQFGSKLYNRSYSTLMQEI